MPNACQPELINAQLERILKSGALVSSPSLCRFLRYVVEETLAGRGGSIKEYSLGVNVFGRGDDFNPRLDPIVRVQARNLRARMARYYSAEGAADIIVIELPKGTYVPVFRTAAETAQPETELIHVAAVHTPEVLQDAPLASVRRSVGVTGPKLIITAVLLLLLAIAVLLISHTHAAGIVAHAPNPLAEDLYTRGRYLMDRQTEAALRESVSCFERAILRDPKYAAAYSGLADAYNLLSQFGYMSPREAMEKARTAAIQSLDIDPRLPEGHVSLAAILEAYDWDWAAAEREYRKALRLNPELPSAHLWYGMFLRDQGRLQEALPELRRAAQLEPFSFLTSVNLASGLLAEGNYGAALEQSRHAAELAPGSAIASLVLSHAYRAADNTADSEAAAAHALESAGENPHALAALACTFMKLGKRDQGQRLFHELERLSKQRYVSPYDMGMVSLMLGDEQRALQLFEEAYQERSSGLIFLRTAKFPGLREAPRFLSIRDRLHFKG